MTGDCHVRFWERFRGEMPLYLLDFLHKYAQRMGKGVQPLSAADKQVLLQYAWPGNVRELQNIIERAVITCRNGKVHLSPLHQEQAAVPQPTARVLTQDELEQLEINNLLLALKKARGKVFGENGAARLIGIPPTTLSSKIKKYGLSPNQYDH